MHNQLLSTRELEAREKQIKVAVNRKLGDHEINHMLKEKEKFMLNPRNYAMYKSKLKKDLDTAIATGQVRRNQQVACRHASDV